MVDFAMLVRHCASRDDASAIAGQDHLAHVVGEVPFGAAQVQYLTFPVHDDWDGLAGAEVLPEFRRSQSLATLREAAAYRAVFQFGKGRDDDHLR